MFSTITGWPRILLALSASERMVMSVGPPAGKAMMSLMGLPGKLWACAMNAGAARLAAPHLMM
ncbi:hypothetical protein D3C77_762530 [compost metagenome]